MRRRLAPGRQLNKRPFPRRHNIPPQAATPLDGIQQVEDHRALHAKVAQLEAQLNSLSFQRESPTSSPDRSSSSGLPGAFTPPFVDQRDNNREMID